MSYLAGRDIALRVPRAAFKKYAICSFLLFV